MAKPGTAVIVAVVLAIGLFVVYSVVQPSNHNNIVSLPENEVSRMQEYLREVVNHMQDSGPQLRHLQSKVDALHTQQSDKQQLQSLQEAVDSLKAHVQAQAAENAANNNNNNNAADNEELKGMVTALEGKLQDMNEKLAELKVHVKEGLSDVHVGIGELKTATASGSTSTVGSKKKSAVAKKKVDASAKRMEIAKTFISKQCNNLDGLRASMGAISERVSTTYPPFTVATYAGSDFVSNDIMASGMWDSSKTVFIQNLLRTLGNKKVTTIDLGANVGWFTFVMAAMGHKVIAFEPMESNWKLITYSVCKNPGMAERVHLYPYGAHERNQVCKMISGEVNRGDGLSICNSTGNTWFNNDQQGLDGWHDGYMYRGRGTIEMIRMDEHVKEDVFLAKLDIEGFELFALKGATNLFKNYNVKYMISEFGPPLMRVMGVNPMDVLNWFDDNNFEIREENFESPVVQRSAFPDLVSRWYGIIGDLYLTPKK
eukprot:TRINITY_DN66711_c11_g1_i1.p1 TRINITY_DN66711_c11_g1~~TRINITY_DN66711_c11_g1_i1.p1  ORF type:complete len:485 (-),score=57.52 TRINITY_DN66711_c11_g1_i1:2132-3586(-)